MRKRVLSCILAVVMMALLMAGLQAAPAQAAGETVTFHVNINGSQYMDKQTILDRINEIRWEACQEGIYGMTTADYVPIKWSSDLEEIALIRAVEATYLFSHTRPNGKDCFSVRSSNGQSSWGEVIASSGNALYAVEMWYSEKQFVVNGINGVTGHYDSMIDPNNRYVAVGSYGVSVGEFSSMAGASEKQIAGTGQIPLIALEIQKSDLQNYMQNYYEDSTYTIIKDVKMPIYFYLEGIQVQEKGTLTVNDPSSIKVTDGNYVKGLKTGTFTARINILGYTATVNLIVVEGSWVQTADGWYYQIPDGRYVISDFYEIGGYLFFFNDQGHPVTGWFTVNGIWYCSNSYGVIQTGWQMVGSNLYYMGSDGAMRTGIVNVSGKYYYFNPSTGAMKTGWVKDGGKYYYFDKSTGVLKTGFLKDGSKYYYLNKTSGALQTGFVQDGGKYYYFSPSNGAMQTGWVKNGGKYYYFDKSTGVMKTGWVKDGGKYYYFNKTTGEMQTGFVKADGKYYYFSPSTGVLQTGWVEDGGKYYYFNPKTGLIQTGWMKDDGKWYYFNKSTGKLEKGYVYIVDVPAHDEQQQVGTRTVVDKEAWTETIVDNEAWTETVVDKEAWTETVVDKEAWTEQIPVTTTVWKVRILCQDCNNETEFIGTSTTNEGDAVDDAVFQWMDHIANFHGLSLGDAHGITEAGNWTEEVPTGEYTTVEHPAETHIVEHPAETHTVDHPAETHTEEHPAETHEEPVYEVIHVDEVGHYKQIYP